MLVLMARAHFVGEIAVEIFRRGYEGAAEADDAALAEEIEAGFWARRARMREGLFTELDVHTSADGHATGAGSASAP